jgi:hypothetical protein
MRETTERGDVVTAITASGTRVPMRVLDGPVMGRDFLVYNVCTEADWWLADSSGDEPWSIPWPCESIEVATSEVVR